MAEEKGKPGKISNGKQERYTTNNAKMQILFNLVSVCQKQKRELRGL